MRSSFVEFVKPLLCGIALFCATPAAAQEAPLVINLNISVDPVKSNGSPWDGYPAVGGKIVVPDASNAADIAVCVVLATGKPECIWRTERKTKLSHCPDSEKCTIDGIRLPGLPAGLILFDVDHVRHDLIDFVILTGDKTAPGEIEKIERNLRTTMANLTPGTSPADRERRKRKPRVLPLDLCVGENAKCDLSQSRFWLEKR